MNPQTRSTGRNLARAPIRDGFPAGRTLHALFYASLLMVAAMPGPAQARPDSLALSCAAASALVRERGAVVIGSGPDLYDRFVADPGYCQSRRTEPAWIATADEKQCLVGQRCRDRRIQIRR